MLRPSLSMDGAGLALTTPIAKDPAMLMTALGALTASQSLPELATAAARLPAQFLEVKEVVVVLQAPEGVFVGGHPAAGEAIERWARALLSDGVSQRYTSSTEQLAVVIDARASAVRGVIALGVASPPDDDDGRRLTELARLVSNCIDQLVGRVQAAQALKDAQTALAKGLHDLRTPLNSLRLGMHLLEPGLAGQDPAIVQRTHRAVDRMATLVTEMFDALHKN